MPYGITQCYLPLGRGDFPAFTPAEAGTPVNHHLGQLSVASLRGVAKSSVSFSWGKGGKVTALGGK